MISLETTIADTCALVRIDSQNPGVQEAACAEWVGNRLVAAGLAPTWHEVLPGRQNLITTVSGNGDAPRLVLLAHLDTVPVGGGWTVPPHGGVVSDGRVYGRGACDMKGGLAVAIGLLEQVHRGMGGMAGDLLLVATVDEEGPDMAGAQHLVASGLLKPDDQVLALEPTGMRLRLAQMGLRWIDLRVTGRMAHAGRAHLGIDSAHVMSRIVDRLKERVAGLPHEDVILGRPRFTCGMIRAGVATNVVPPSAEASFDVRIVPPMLIDDVVPMVSEVAELVMADFPGATFTIEPLGAPRPPVRADEGSRIVSGLRSAYRSETGQLLPHGGDDGHEAYTDASMVAALTESTSCTVFGPGSTDQAHTADEYVPISDLDLAGRVMERLIGRW